MGIAAWGWDRNWVRQGRLTASSQVGELGVGNLQSDHGGAWAGWQSAGTSAWLTTEMLQAVPWRVLLLARTNLTADATVRWRIGGPDILAAPTALPTDTASGATKGSATTRTGSVAGPSGGSGAGYTNAAGSSFVRPGTVTVRAGCLYQASVWMRRIVAGGSVAGSAIIAEYLTEAGVVTRSGLAMALVAQSTTWQLLTCRWRPGRDGVNTLYLAADTGALQYELGPATVGMVAEYDSGVIAAGVVPGIGQSVHVLPAEVQGHLATCEIADPSNPDGFINIALSYQGPLTQTAINIGWGGGHGRTQGGADVRTRGGAEYPRLDWTARTREIEHNAVLDTEIWPVVMALDAYARRGGNVLLLPDPDSLWLAQEALYGRLRTTALLTTPLNTEDRVAWRATIEERL